MTVVSIPRGILGAWASVGLRAAKNLSWRAVTLGSPRIRRLEALLSAFTWLMNMQVNFLLISNFILLDAFNFIRSQPFSASVGDLMEAPSHHLLGCVKELGGRLPNGLVSPEGRRASEPLMITKQL